MQKQVAMILLQGPLQELKKSEKEEGFIDERAKWTGGDTF